MSSMRVLVPLVVCLITGLGCARNPGQKFRGRWLEAGGFEPCGTTEKWWTELDSTLMAHPVVETTMVFMPAPADTGGAKAYSQPPSFLRVAMVRGDTSPLGSYGPNGAYQRRILLHEVGHSRLTLPADCR